MSNDSKVWELKDHKILVQNLLNRATEIEIHNAQIDKRVADVRNIEVLLAEIGRIAHKSITLKKDQLGM